MRSVISKRKRPLLTPMISTVNHVSGRYHSGVCTCLAPRASRAPPSLYVAGQRSSTSRPPQAPLLLSARLCETIYLVFLACLCSSLFNSSHIAGLYHTAFSSTTNTAGPCDTTISLHSLLSIPVQDSCVLLVYPPCARDSPFSTL